jgi:UDP-N-acetylglucosamine--N-acetylmuramyl-(pentapeptide) pyrophosphoryl-undecaprenol N-acetylglucosamine transferase
MKKTIVICTNHHTPAIKLIEQLKKDKRYQWRIEYISHLHSRETHIKNSILPLKIKFHQFESNKFDRFHPIKSTFSLPQIIPAIKKARRLIKRIKPDLIISFGGYTSIPIIIASYFQKIPCITHEQTSTFSLATIINSFFVNKVALSFPANKGLFPFLFARKISLTGNLLRSEIYSLSTKNYKKIQTPFIYVTGGSQGAKVINQNVLALIDKLGPKTRIIHNTGQLDYPSIIKETKNKANYYPTPYINLDDIGWVLNNASLIISRAGANTCQEIVALKKNAILIPLPKSQQDEQLKNALWVKKQLTQTIIISQDKLTPDLLLKKIKIHRQQTPSSIERKDNLKVLQLIHSLV